MLCAGCAITPPASPTGYDAAVASLQNNLETQGRLIGDLTLRIDGMEQRLTDQQKQLQALQTALAAQKVTSIGENTALPVHTPGSGTVQPPASPTETYLKAFGDYTSGRYNQAIEGFETFLKYFPANNYAGNAQFWLGECYYRLGQYDRAVGAYQKVVDNYPLSGKAPDALLRMAPALRQLNQYEKARQALQTLQQRYPDSAAARKAMVGP